MPDAESIPDPDAIHRQIDFPTMYGKAQEFLWHNVFAFPSPDLSESVVWAKYASTDDAVHYLGRERIKSKQQLKPEYRYVGFISSTAGSIRSICTAAGHGFAVNHEPDQGIHHAEISYRPANNQTASKLSKSEKNELKIALQMIFGNLQRDQLCDLPVDI